MFISSIVIVYSIQLSQIRKEKKYKGPCPIYFFSVVRYIELRKIPSPMHKFVTIGIYLFVTIGIYPYRNICRENGGKVGSKSGGKVS